MKKLKTIIPKQGEVQFDDLHKNDFVKSAIIESCNVTSKILKSDPKLENKNNRSRMSKKEKTIIDLFYYTNEVLSKLQTLEYYLVFLNSYPNSKSLRKISSRSEYIVYHFESYLNNVIGVFDRCLNLINFVYDLGIEDKHVKFELIISNKHIKNEPIREIIILFDKVLKNIRKLRNSTTHHRRYSDEDLVKMNMLERIIKHQKDLKLTNKQISGYKILLKMHSSSYIRKNKKSIKDNNNNIFKVCDYLFYALGEKNKAKSKSLVE